MYIINIAVFLYIIYQTYLYDFYAIFVKVQYTLYTATHYLVHTMQAHKRAPIDLFNCHCQKQLSGRYT